MKLRSRFVLAAVLLCTLAFSAPAFADSHGQSAKSDPTSETGKPGPEGRREPSAEDRAKMADAHQQMAECLRSDRPMKECRGEMKKAHAAFGHGQGHGKQCTHGASCPHDASCPHGDACDGSCKHHGPHGDEHGGHGAMSTPKDAKAKTPSKDDAAAAKKKLE